METKRVAVHLGLPYRLAKMIGDHDGPRVVQAWFTRLNRELNNRVPIRMLRDRIFRLLVPRFSAPRPFLADFGGLRLAVLARDWKAAALPNMLFTFKLVD